MKHLEPYYGRIELYAALAALGLAVIAGIYLAFTTIVEKEACYGISGAKVVCQPLTGENAVETVGRLLLILSIVFAMYAASAAAAWWQGRARGSDARVTAYMVLLTCALTVFGITFPAVSGVGFFFIPSMVVLLAAAGIGLAALLRANRSSSTAR